MRVTYDKLKRYVEASPGYVLKERGNDVELVFTTPSLEEAAGIGEGEGHRLIVLRGVREGEYVRFTQAQIRSGEHVEPLDLKDLELWLEYIENFA